MRIVNFKKDRPMQSEVNEKLIVWILYRNEPGQGGRVMGLFSSAEKAKSYPLIQEETLDNVWVLKDLQPWKFWMCQPVGKKYRLTIEPSIVDKPDNDEEQNRIFTSQLGDITLN
jgi:hypothetical protein